MGRKRSRGEKSTSVIERKRRRRDDKILQNWGSLPIDLLDSVLERLGSIYDYIRFTKVCKHWREVALKQKEQRLKSCEGYLTPLLLLTPYKKRNRRRDLYSVTQAKVVHSFTLPNHSDDYKWLRGCSHGWLAYTDGKFLVNLVNPCTGGTIRLPQVMGVGESDSEFEIALVVLSANPSLYPDDFEVLVMFENIDDGESDDGENDYGVFKLSHLKSGDNCWSRFDNQMIEGLGILDIMYYKGQFVALTDSHADPGDNIVRKFLPTIEFLALPQGANRAKARLVKSTNEDLQIVSIDRIYQPSGIKIFKLLESSCGDRPAKWYKTSTINLGTEALFMNGHCMHSLYVSSSYSRCHPNSMYLTEGVVDLKSRTKIYYHTLGGFPTRRAGELLWIAPTVDFSI